MRLLGNTHLRNSILCIALCVTAAASYLAVTRVPGPLVDRMIAADTKRLAIKWKHTIVENLEDGAESFVVGRAGTEDIAFLRLLLQSSDIYRVKLLSRGGTVFWASRDTDIGSVVDATYFHEQVANGELYFESFDEVPAQVDGYQLSGDENQGTLRVAEVYVPVMGNRGFVGAIEFYTDVTDTRESYITLIRTALLTVCGTGMIALFLVSGGITRAGDRAVRDMRARAEKERVLMDEQIRLSREVRLLGELNEWLQSASSLDELFDMVSRFLSHMMPESAGSIYVYSNSRDVLDGRTSWNGGVPKPQIRADECWGLRRGRTYTFVPDDLHFACAHATDGKEGNKAPYYCFPILAHGETVGLMHLAAKPGLSAADFKEYQRLAQMSAEQISMAIANVRMRDQLLDQSIRDPLTGLFNRRHMMDHLRRLTDAAGRSSTDMCVLSLDVDHFKKFNDNHGHDAGDMVLRAVGSALERACDGDEIVCRMGGEEFLMLLPDTPASKAMSRAELIRKSIEEIRVRYGEKTLPRVTVSVGVSIFPDHGRLPQDLIRASDDALYEAKAKGRNRIVLALNEAWESETSTTMSAAAGATPGGSQGKSIAAE